MRIDELEALQAKFERDQRLRKIEADKARREANKAAHRDKMMSHPGYRVPSPERTAAILKRRVDGLTLKQIGAEFGLSGTYIRDVCARDARRKAKAKDTP